MVLQVWSMRMRKIIQNELRMHHVPSRELTYPTWGKGKSSSKVPWDGDILRIHMLPSGGCAIGSTSTQSTTLEGRSTHQVKETQQSTSNGYSNDYTGMLH